MNRLKPWKLILRKPAITNITTILPIRMLKNTAFLLFKQYPIDFLNLYKDIKIPIRFRPGIFSVDLILNKLNNQHRSNRAFSLRIDFIMNQFYLFDYTKIYSVFILLSNSAISLCGRKALETFLTIIPLPSLKLSFSFISRDEAPTSTI